MRVLVPGEGGARYNVEHKMATVGGDSASGFLHEYGHHLQKAMPALQRLFCAEHLRRTTFPDGTRHPKTVLRGFEGQPHIVGRDDDYVLDYVGRDYGGDLDGLEVLPEHLATVFHDHFGDEYLGTLATDDPRMLDLVLGFLFHWNP